MYQNLFQGSQIYGDYINDPDFIRNDRKLNRTLVDMAYLGLMGFTVGAAVSLFFKNKVMVRNFGAGFGIGYGFHYNMKELLGHQRPKQA